MKKMWYIYGVMEHYSAIKKLKLIICNNVDGTREYYSFFLKDFIYLTEIETAREREGTQAEGVGE